MNYLSVSPSPHQRAATTTRQVMLDVLIALTPALIGGIYFFGLSALLLTAVCVAGCMLMEWIYRKAMKLPSTVGDLSAAVTGMLIAFCLPSNFPIWMALVGCFFAIIVTKQLFGGIGKNFANPAIVARIVLLIAFPTQMTTFPPVQGPTVQFISDAVSGATPLALHARNVAIPYSHLFVGNVMGCLGETSVMLLLVGFIYLLLRRRITVTTTLSILGSVALFAWISGGNPLFHIMSGGVMLGAVFMATDYVTTPITERGKLIFGIGCGVITMVVRLFGAYPEGVSFGILLMNILTPHIQRFTRVRPFGVERKKRKQGGEGIG